MTSDTASSEATPVSATKPTSKAPSFIRAAGTIAGVTILAKLLGFFRDWAIFNVYGASLTTDAYFAAVQLPWFAIVLLGGLGGPFHTATIAIFAKLVKDNEAPNEKARRLASTFITLTGALFAALSLLVWLFAQDIMTALLPDASAELITHAAQQLQIMSPIIFTGGLIGIFYGILNIYHCFAWPSLSPAAMSLVIIVALLLNRDDPTGMTLAYATLGGAIAQFTMQLPDFLKYKFSLRPAWSITHPDVRDELKTLGEVLFPIIIGTTIGQLMVYVDMLLVSQLEEGGWSAVILSNRLMQLPIGVLQTAFLVPIFPRFSRYVGEKDWGALRRDFHMGVTALWMISFPVLVMIFMFAEPLIRLVFEHGAFDARDTNMVTLALLFQAFQMIPYFARDTLTRVFYAFNNSMVPMLIGFLALAIKFGLNTLLIQQYGLGGITLSTTLITLINMSLLMILAQKQLISLEPGRLIIPFLKLSAAAGVMLLVLWAGVTGLHASLQFDVLAFANMSGWPLVTNSLPAIVLLAIAMAAYAGTAMALKVNEAHYIGQRIIGLIKRK